ncbi:3-dehydroquinate synthase [Alkalihalobacillus sp. TS-13]|uniref:3-dehydroquinate synthase n=1 Tax=Alkalihalobacillus sp. TS-13 TaxID=2842455 RepID=UPI001C8851EB|nr:3-dehydroquinate synthase [Alkalihalobacillus sp. TS-13]
METIEVRTDNEQYPVFIGQGMISNLNNIIKESVPECSSILIISDSNVAPLYLELVKKELEDHQVNEWVIPAGESSKSLREYEKGITYALRCQLDRKSLIIALGGGVVGDLAGFIAATYLRGIRFIQIPTTLLAHDSSVGGKVGINHSLGKNLIGAFHQPEAVLFDIDFLKTLPAREWRSGFAEIVKMGLIRDARFYEYLSSNVETLPVKEDILEKVIKRAIELKAEIVRLDEREAGIRAYLNLGHTLGHAIEAESRYQSISHGEAVMIGMLYAIKLSEKRLDRSIVSAKFYDWISQLGYANWHPTLNRPRLLLERIKQDKKNSRQQIWMVLLEECGVATLEKVEDQFILEQLDTFKSWVKSNGTR